MERKVYADHSATTAVRPEVLEAMPASSDVTWVESASSLMRAVRLPWTASSAPRLASSTMVPEESTTKVAPALE